METKLNINDKKGIFTALLTPFDKNNKINAKALEELIKFNVKMGVNGFYVTGSTGEAFLLSTEERKGRGMFIMRAHQLCHHQPLPWM